jgi:hypothetical protein
MVGKRPVQSLPLRLITDGSCRPFREDYATQQHGGINSAGRGPVQSDLAPMKTKTYFAFRVDVWDSAANSIVEHVAGIRDFEVAVATYWAAVARWPAARITLRRGIRVVHDTG